MITNKFARAAFALSFAVIATGFVFDAASARDPSELEKTIADVQRRWPQLSHLPAADVAKMAEEKSAVIFDVRSEEEYNVSHLEGAVRVDPAIDREAFLAAHAQAVKGKKVVFYCSVGVRSSKLAERVGDGVIAAGATAVHNLRGGIFAWHEENRPLFDTKGQIESLHPYNNTWGRAVTRKDQITTEPR